MNKIRPTAILYFFILNVVIASACAEVSTQLELKNNEGFLLIETDALGLKPTLEIEHGEINQKKKIHTRRNRNIKISLLTDETSFTLIALPHGKYHTVRLDVPHYNTPYWLNLSNEEDWEFHIQAQSVNYLGTIDIKKERVLGSVSTSLLNTTAQSYKKIQLFLQSQKLDYPIAQATRYRDDFLLELSTPSVNSRAENQ